MELPTKARELYPEYRIEYQKARYNEAYEEFRKLYSETPDYVFSAPGRSEICGNHTDHNMGKAVGASIDLDIIAMVKKTDTGRIRLKSKGYDYFDFPFNDTSLKEGEHGRSISLIKGIIQYFTDHGYNIGGFDAYTVSDVKKGSGLSSSAAFEILVSGILNGLYNDNKISPKDLAMASHFAENVFFCKACGTLDQLSCAYGGMIAIDFENPADPKATPVRFDLSKTGYTMVITDVHADHADLTADYTAIRREMESVAEHFGKKNLRQVSFEEFKNNLPELKAKLPGRAIIRAFHFFNENERVEKLKAAMSQNDMSAFLNTVNESGNSSFKYLQNIYPNSNPLNQSLSLALCLTESILKEDYACRVHGGGFGGTIQAYMKREKADSYIKEMNAVFGEGSSFPLQIRLDGCVMMEI